MFLNLVFFDKRLVLLLTHRLCHMLLPPGVEVPGRLPNVHALVITRAKVATQLILDIRPQTISSIPLPILAGQAVSVVAARCSCGVRFLHLAFNSASTIFNKSKFHSYFHLLVCNFSELLDQFTLGCGRNKYGCYTATLRRPGFGPSGAVQTVSSKAP
jgi:hypothetical protein